MAPGLLAGAGLVLLSAMKELPLTLLLSPPGFPTLSTRIWSAAGCMIAGHPINGVGTRGFRDAYPQCVDEQGPAVWGAEPALHAHQIVLEILPGFLPARPRRQLSPINPRSHLSHRHRRPRLCLLVQSHLPSPVLLVLTLSLSHWPKGHPKIPICGIS